MSELPENSATERLRQAIDEDVARIELWVLALSSFAKPAPRYDFGDRNDREAAR